MTSFFDQYKSHIDIENINIALAEAKKKFSLPIYQKYHETLKKAALLNQFTIPQEQSTSFNLQGPSELDLKVEELAKELTPWRKGPIKLMNCSLIVSGDQTSNGTELKHLLVV